METLVLSHSYLPVDRICWQRAVTLWFLDKVEIVEAYDDRVIRSTSFELEMPAVVRFLHRVRTHLSGFKLSRENVFARDKGRCQYCGTKLTRPTATWDHVVPRALGGRTSWQNIVLSCVQCNQAKGGRLPQQAGMKLRSEPVAPRALPPTFRFTFADPEKVPECWRQYLWDVAYWNCDLEER